MLTQPYVLLLFQPILCILAVASGDKELMISSWKEGNWSKGEKNESEYVIYDKVSGCICRYREQEIVCYGASSCFSFPRNIDVPSTINDFRLKTTGLTSLLVGDLEKLSQTIDLEIDANSKLTWIEPGIFANLSRLINLSISFNSDLKSLQPATFEGLVSLKSLKLIKNGFQKIEDVSMSLSVSYLPELQVLSLSQNVFKNINECSFDTLIGSNIVELNLLLCQIETISNASLRNFKKLEKLRLGENLIEEDALENLFDSMVQEDIPLTDLDLYEVGLRKGEKLTSLLKVISKLKVSHLILRRNHIEFFYEGLFPYMPYIELLDLREVSAIDIETNALSEDLLPNLKVLLLAGNKLWGVMPGLLLPQLSVLDVSMNSGSFHSPSYFDVNSNFFENLTDLESLNMSFNRIVSISNETFLEVRNLRVLDLQNSTIFYIARRSFATLKKLLFLNLNNNPFQPFNTFPDLIFEGLESLEMLLLSGCKIASFSRLSIFNSLTNLKYLSLRENNLLKISPTLFREASLLKTLDLSFNRLEPWANRIFSERSKPSTLLVANNRFTYVTQAMMDDFEGMVQVDVVSNPFICDCQFYNEVDSWSQDNNFTSENINFLQDSNLCVSPDEWRDKSIFLFFKGPNKQCVPVKPNTHVIYILLGAFCFLVVLFSFLGYYYRWHIRYLMFLTTLFFWKRYGCFRRKRNNQIDDYKYDVFVSYSHENRNFVIRLVKMLENYEPYLKLCVYERDFEIGTVISDTVMDKVAGSRKVLLVVSEAFAKSQWCMWELQLAEYHCLFFKPGEANPVNDSLVIVKLGYISGSDMTPTLRYLLKTRIYLEWSSEYKKQKVFWEKLRNALSPNIIKVSAV